MKHVLYTEEVENYQVAFKYITDIKKGIFETTLLDNLQLSQTRFNYHNLSSAVMLQCFTFNSIESRYTPVKFGKHIAAVHFDTKHSSSREWQNFNVNHDIPKEKEEEDTKSRFAEYSKQPQKPIQLETAKQTKPASTQMESVRQLKTSLVPMEDTLHAYQTKIWVKRRDKPSFSSNSSVRGQSEDGTLNSKSTPLPSFYS